MKILVTGANGQVGQEFVKIANNMRLSRKQQLELVCLDRIGLDVTDIQHVVSVFEFQRPHLVINCAAFTAVDKAESAREAAFAVNETGARNLALQCRRVGAALIHISTDYVFSGDKAEPYEEIDATGPIGAYGESKLAGESAIAEVLKQYIILRTAWVFGADGKNFVKTMLRLAIERDELSVVGDQFGAPTSSKGIADCCMEIASQINVGSSSELRWGIYHFSGAPFTSWHGFSHSIFKAALDIGLIHKVPKIKEISTDQFPTSAKRPVSSKLNCNKIFRYFSILPDDWVNQLRIILEEKKYYSDEF